MDGVCKNSKKCNPNKDHKILIVFDTISADTFGNKKRH